MAKYRKKPVVVDAVQYTGGWGSALPILVWMKESWPIDRSESAWFSGDNTLRVQTLEGAMSASPGDYNIRGVKGEFYPCKPDIFEATYELVEP